jgi:hypothetical protein
MTMRPFLLLSAVTLFSACTDGSGKDDTADPGTTEEADSDTDTDTDSDTDADSDTDTDTDTDADADNASISGRVVFSDGSPAENVQMRLCYEVCLDTRADSSGNWSFNGVGNVDHTLQAVVLGDTSYAIPHAITSLRDDESRALTTDVIVPKFAAKTELTTGSPTTVEGDGIIIEAMQGSIEQGSYTPDRDQFYVASVEMPATDAGIPWDGVPGTPVAVWFLGNFDSTVEPSFPFRTTSTYGLEVGTVVQVWSSSNEDHGWVSGGSATVTADGIVSDPGSGIRKLNTLVLTIADE